MYTPKTPPVVMMQGLFVFSAKAHNTENHQYAWGLSSNKTCLHPFNSGENQYNLQYTYIANHTISVVKDQSFLLAK